MIEKESYDYGKSNSRYSKKKKIICIIAISFTALIILTTIILIGHFKFNWFKKTDDEADKDTYNLDVKIKRTVNQVDYFTETKKIKTKVVYTSGESDEQEQIVNTSFAVFFTDKTVNDNFTNLTSTLVILDSKVKFGEKETKLNSFDIFDEKQIKEFESNPNGTIVPLAKFSYFENGTIIDINLPENMDQYNTQAMIELINNVVPKLSRNKKEDKKKGLTAAAKKTRNGDTLTEIQAPKEYTDKFTGEEYKGSKFEKKTEVDVENEKIKKVSTNTNLVLETQKENEETLDFGLQNFTYDIASEIKSTKNEENNQENIQLVKQLSEKLNFIKSDDLVKSLLLKEHEKNSEFENFTKNVENEKKEEKSETEVNNSKQTRKLGWEGVISESWTLARSNILGKTVELTYEISLSGGKLSNTLSVSCGSITIPLGNKGLTEDDSDEDEIGDISLFEVPFSISGVPITFSFGFGGGLGYDVSYDTYANELSLSLSGELYANAKLVAGICRFADITVGARGTLIRLTAESTLTKTGRRFEISSNRIIASGGIITCYFIGELLNREVFDFNKEVTKGWRKYI